MTEETYLERLGHFWGCKTPIIVIARIQNEVKNNIHYYSNFSTPRQLLKAIAWKVINNKIFDFHTNEWLTIN